jgi:fatty acid desaturase
VVEFSEEETAEETRGEWYFRQLLGSANLTGSKLFHIMAGNLSHQIEHHLFPDIPAHRYGEIAVEVSELCARFGIPYNTGPLGKQFGSVVKKICRLALPGRGRTLGRARCRLPMSGRSDQKPLRSRPEGSPSEDRKEP